MKIKIFILFFLLLVAVLISIKVGEVRISWSQIFDIFSLKLSSIDYAVVFKIRLPRILIAIIVGAGLAVSGVVFQTLLRNPLAEPYTLGVSGGACLGVAILNIIGFSKIGFSLPLAGFLGALFSISIVYLLANRKGFSNISLILSGIILNFLFSSIVLLIFAFLRPQQVQSMILWLMGDLSSANFNLVRVSYILITIAIIIIFIFSRELDVLSLGEERAHFLGLNPQKMRKIFFVLASLITGTAISVSGVIGFVGLLIPHLMRKFVGPNHTGLLISSSISGAIFLLISDTFSRTIISPIELPVGVVTGLVGGGFFLFILIFSKEWKIV
jgi:iron complex transport system permease protein